MISSSDFQLLVKTSPQQLEQTDLALFDVEFVQCIFVRFPVVDLDMLEMYAGQ